MTMDYKQTLNAINAAKEAAELLLDNGLYIADYFSDNNGAKFTVLIDEHYSDLYMEKDVLFMCDPNDILDVTCNRVRENEYITYIRLRCGANLKNGVLVTFHSSEFVDVRAWYKYQKLNKVCTKCNGVIDCDDCPIYQWKLAH